jgi:hypothetical protein
MKIYLLTLLLLAASVVPAPAKDRVADATMVPTADATLTALAAVLADSRSRQAQLTTRVTALQRQIAAVKAKVKNQKIEVGEQLSKEDLDAFNLLNAQLRYLQDAVTVEAVRQRNLAITKDIKDIYRASFFTATMMTEYIGDRGGLDDDFDDFCRAKAKTYGLEVPVGLLFSVQDYIIDAGAQKK